MLQTHHVFEKEAGKHIVQRVPPTERSGRVHTSVVTVSVLLLNDSDYKINDKDIEVKTQRGHGKGGQHQNKTDSAVRMKHKPTGLEVFINGRDQHANKKLALKILSNRVRSFFEEKKHQQFYSSKFNQIGYGNRSNKIRTYNFVHDRAVDHRNNKKCSLQKVMKGNFNELN